MQMLQCPNCGKLTGFKRALGFGTLFMVILTCGLWLLVIPFYPARCINCGLTRGSAISHNFAVWFRELSPASKFLVLVSPVLLLLGLALFNARSNKEQNTSKGADLFAWPVEGLPGYVADALSTPDLAPTSPEDGTRKLSLGASGQQGFIPAVKDEDCMGSGGCSWKIDEGVTGKEILEDSQGVLHKTGRLTNGYYDLLVEGKLGLYVYEFHDGRYVNAICYGRSNGLGSSAITEPCSSAATATIAPVSNDAVPVSAIRATDLLVAFHADEKTASTRYNDRRIAVTGTLTGVFIPSVGISLRVAKQGGSADAFVTMGGPTPASAEETLLLPGITAYSEETSLFGQRAINSVTEQLRVGEAVTLDCTFKNALRVSDLTISRYNGNLDYSIQLNNCILEENEATNASLVRQEQSQSDTESAVPTASTTLGQQNGDAAQVGAISTVQPSRVNSTEAHGISAVSKGQTPEQVIAILGPPSSVTTGATHVYNYPHLSVVFVDGRVSELHEF